MKVGETARRQNGGITVVEREHAGAARNVVVQELAPLLALVLQTLRPRQISRRQPGGDQTMREVEIVAAREIEGKAADREEGCPREGEISSVARVGGRRGSGRVEARVVAMPSGRELARVPVRLRWETKGQSPDAEDAAP